MAIHILHELVYSARLFMKMSSWGFCVLVFEPSGELGDCPQETECGVPYSSGTKFVVGRSTSYEESTSASTGAPWKIRQICSMIVLYFGNSLLFTMNSLFQVQLVMVHVFLRLAMCQQMPK